MTRDIPDDGTDLPRVPLVVATDLVSSASISFVDGGCLVELKHGVAFYVDPDGEVHHRGEVALLRDLLRKLYVAWSEASGIIANGMDLSSAENSLMLDVLNEGER